MKDDDDKLNRATWGYEPGVTLARADRGVSLQQSNNSPEPTSTTALPKNAQSAHRTQPFGAFDSEL